MKPELIFLHIEKAAGSSLRNLFYKNFEQLNVYWHDINKDSADDYKIVGGHRSIQFYSNKLIPRTHKTIYLGVMREPVSRVISFYAHLKRYTDYFTKYEVSSFKDAVLNCQPFRAHIQSGQLVYLIGQKEFSKFEIVSKENNYVIGTMDHLDSFTMLIANKLGFKEGELSQENLGLPGYKDKIELDNETLSELEDLLQEDVKLYNYIIEKHSGLYDNTVDTDWSRIKKKLLSLPTAENKSFEGSCSFVSPEALPTSIPAAKNFAFNVVLKNNSTSLWTSNGGAINLSYHWLNPKTNEVVIFEGVRTPLCESIRLSPTENINSKMKVRTPPKPGDYLLKLIPMKTKHRWFDSYEFYSDTQLFTII